MNQVITYRPIGLIHSPFETRSQAPRQSRYAGEGDFWVEVFPEYRDGMEGLEVFNFIYLIYHAHMAEVGPILKVRPPHLKGKEVGVFASRSPRRPNNLALDVVRLLAMDGGRLTISATDALDGTPLLDIKPYYSDLDSHPEAVRGADPSARRNLD